MKRLRLILNGKKAGLEEIRHAVFSASEPIDVRVTWQGGDIDRLVKEAVAEGCERIMIGGGDGSVKEVVDALMQIEESKRPELAILPLGTANDFATACEIPTLNYSQAIELAQNGKSYAVDCVKAGDEHFINVASGGFGAFITANTPVELKNFLGGGAYTLNGLVQSLNFKPNHGELKLPDQQVAGDVVVSAVCNGRQAGGGQQLAPRAKINDGMIDIVALMHTPAEFLLQTVKEILNPQVSGTYVKRFRAPWAEWSCESGMPINLDGEPIQVQRIRFEVVPGSIQLVLPKNCPLI